jgi:CBS domain-containing protein
MGKVRDILNEKGRQVYSLPSDVTVFEAIQIMCDKNIGGLVIVDDDQLVGIFTERDYARKVVLRGKSSKDTLLHEVMTSRVITVSSDESVEECMELMTNRHIRHLPIMDNGRLCGLVSIGDVVRFVIHEQKEIIHHLEHYIAGQ